MTAAHSLTSDAPDGLESPEPRGRSFWASAPGLLTGLGAILGSVVGLATVLVQAGVIGSSSTPSQVAPAQASAAVAMPAVTTPAVTAPAVTTPAVTTPAEEPSLERSLRRLNELLAESARTRGDLGSLIADVKAEPPIPRGAALREIDAIVRQRQGLHRTIGELPAPDELSNALALLRDSVTASLADDRLVRQWIVARYDGDAAVGRLEQAEWEASREATRAKTAFRDEYRAILLSAGLPSSIPEY
jgi:hypothetical protein